MYEYDENPKQEKNHNTLWVVLAIIFTLFIGLGLGYVIRENQAEDNANETIQQNQQDRQDAVDNFTPPTLPSDSTPSTPSAPTEPTTPQEPSNETPSTPRTPTTEPDTSTQSN
jgi:cytoskeletal protein RodZ